MEIPLSFPQELKEYSVHSVKSNSSKGKRQYLKRSIDKIRRWSSEECQKYEDFILNNEELMNGSNSNRATKIFLMMSEYIATKTPTQCRSHHQKFFKRVMKKKTSVLATLQGSSEDIWNGGKRVKTMTDQVFEYTDQEPAFLSGESIETNISNDDGGISKAEQEDPSLFWEKDLIKLPILNILSKSDDQMNVDWLQVIQNAHRRNSSFSDILEDENTHLISQ